MKPFLVALIFGFAFGSLNSLYSENNPPAPGAPTPGAQAPAPDSPPATQPPTRPDPAKDPGVRKLTRREKKDLIAKLPEAYQQFLKDVEPIILPTEINTFLLLESDAQRDVYIEQFWLRRDSDPKTAFNEYREQYQESLVTAKQFFKYLSSDRARVYLIEGPPDDRLVTTCDKLLQPMEVWHYTYLPGVGHDTEILFYESRLGGVYKLFAPIGSGDDSLADLVSQEVMSVVLDPQAAVRYVFYEPVDPLSTVSKIQAECKDGAMILNAIYKTKANSDLIQHVYEPPKVNEEDINKMLRTAVITDPKARKIAAQVTPAYTGKRGARTAVELSITLPKGELVPKDISGTSYYDLDVNGEVLKDGKLFESYRYKFDVPVTTVVDNVPLSVERFLRPAEYQSRMKIVDVNSRAEAIVETMLQVPEIPDDPRLAAERSESSATLEKLQTDLIRGQSLIRIVPPGDDLLTGLQHIDTIVTGEKIAAVEFYLDGRKVMTKRSRPYSLDLDLGNVPQPRKIKAMALDAVGQPLGGDEIVLNVAQEPFHVRIVSPRISVNVKGRVHVEMEASVPDGKSLDSVQLYLNETRVATLYSPPFVQTINVPADLGIAYLRAVATLKEPEVQAVEDVVFINSPQFLAQVDVHLIELPTTVIAHGHPVPGLESARFTILDEGKPAKLSKFEYVKNLPLSLGVAVDTSGSMRPRINDAQKAGAEFFKDVLRSGDQAFIVSFDKQPVLVQKWTKNLMDLNAGLASLRAEESTALYDAIVYSLFKFQTVKGQKALVVITDGKDTSSNFTFDQALEYAKRSGVPIYGIGINLHANEVETRYKLGKFSSETGGNAYYIDDVVNLSSIYAEIEGELRSQYLLGFYPPEGVATGSKWRTVEVQVDGGKARTMRGYYP
jgi:Ca-activated chloride channel family protein